MKSSTEPITTDERSKKQIISYQCSVIHLGWFVGKAFDQYFDRHPIIKSSHPEIKYSILERDSIFRDSLFGDIRIKQFLVYVKNEGDNNAENVKVKFTTLLDMEIGTDIGVKKDEFDYGGPDSTLTRLYFIKDPLKKGQQYRFNLVMNGNSFDRSFKSFLSKPGNSKKSLPIINIESDQGFGLEKQSL
jgi:hypothetical protein